MENDLQPKTTFRNYCEKHCPELLDEWDTEKNAALTPDDVTIGSHKKGLVALQAMASMDEPGYSARQRKQVPVLCRASGVGRL